MLLSSRWQREFCISSMLVLLAVVAYGHLLEAGATPYSKHSDLVAQHLAMKNVAYESLQRGEGLPLWKTDQMGGGPALTHPQALFTHPLQLLFLVFEPTAAAGPTLFLHFLAMAVSMQLLGAVMGLGGPARVFMAVAGLFSFKMIILGYAGWLPVLPGLVLAPLLFASVLEIMQRPRAASGLLLALAGALALHSGHLQFFYLSTLLLGTYLAVQLAFWLRAGRGAHARQVLKWCAVGALLASLSAAYLLLPLLAELPLTSRAGKSYEFFQSRGAYALRTLITFLHPEALGTPIDDSYADVELWEDVAYFGAIPLALALLGLVAGGRRHHARFFAVGFVISVVLVFDTRLLRLLFDFLPGLGLFRHPSRFLFMTTLLGVPLAAIGLERMLEWLESRLPRRRARLLGPGIAGLIALVVAGEGYHYARRYIEMVPASQAFPETRYASLFASDASLFRIAPAGRHTLNYGWASFMDLELITGFDAYNYRHFVRYIGLLTQGKAIPDGPTVWTDVDRIARADLLDALNVKYLVIPREIQRPHFELVGSFPDEPAFAFYRGLTTTPIYVYENLRVLPRSYFATRLLPARDAEHALKLVLRRNLHDATVVESRDATTGPLPVGANASARFDVRKGDRHVLATTNARRGFLVIGEVWHPGWRALLDGAPIPLQRVNVALMGAWIPSGKHELVLEFRPLYWSLARGLSLFALLGLIALAGVALRSTRREGPRP